MNEYGRRGTVLIAEDDEVDLLFLQEALEERGGAGDVRSVKDGEELMDYLHRQGRFMEDPPPRPALILLDLRMPRKDGFEALREIREDPDLRLIPVVILSTSRMEEDIQRAYELGADSYITKPDAFEGLVEAMGVLEKYGFKTVSFQRGERPMNESERRGTVLIAEDDEEDLLLIQEALEECGNADGVQSVKDGEELMDYLHRQGRFMEAPPPRPVLILLDLRMPRKDGFEALREIREDPDLRLIPVVILSTSRLEEDVQRGYELGANSYISKPDAFEGLVEAMSVLEKYWFKTVSLPRPNGEQPYIL